MEIYKYYYFVKYSHLKGLVLYITKVKLRTQLSANFQKSLIHYPIHASGSVLTLDLKPTLFKILEFFCLDTFRNINSLICTCMAKCTVKITMTLTSLLIPCYIKRSISSVLTSCRVWCGCA